MTGDGGSAGICSLASEVVTCIVSILTLVANPITFPRQTSITASQVRRSQEDQRQTPQEQGLCITTDLSKYLITITDESYNKSREER